MTYQEHNPSGALAADVDGFWTAQGTSAQRILPDGCIDIIFNLHDGSARVVGVMTRAIMTPSGRESSYLGVRFRPGAAFGLLGVSARETRDAMLTLEDVWGASGRELSQRVYACASHVTRVAQITEALRVKRARAGAQDARVVRAVQEIAAQPGRVSVSKLACALGLSERQLERLFDEHVGIGPKLLARVLRMQRAVAQLNHASMTKLAFDCGYADQAHMIRELEAMTGVTLKALARERAMSDLFNPP